MLRPDDDEDRTPEGGEVTSSCRTVPAGESPVRVSAGALGSRPQARGEILAARAGRLVDMRYGRGSFDFLGCTFRKRRSIQRCPKYHFMQRRPSSRAMKRVRERVHELTDVKDVKEIIASLNPVLRGWGNYFKTGNADAQFNQIDHYVLEDLARLTDPVVRGWMNYYGRFFRSKCVQVLRHLNDALVAWACRKYKRFRRRERAAAHWLGTIAKREPRLLALWSLGVRPAAGTGGAG